MGFQGAAPQPGIAAIFLHAINGGLQSQPACCQTAAVRGSVSRMGTLEKNENRLVQPIAQSKLGMELAGHIHDRAQPAIIAPPCHVETNVGMFRLHRFDDRNVIARLARDHPGGFLDHVRT